MPMQTERACFLIYLSQVDFDLKKKKKLFVASLIHPNRGDFISR